ncbi:MAG TPA: molybdopterin cofactor-binding domain-containing protein [Candidatus Elarobacter sp.]
MQTRAQWLFSAGAAFVLVAAGDAPVRASASAFAPGPWLAFHDDGTVTILAGKAEMGQGVRTSLPMLVAEELDVPWSSVRVETATPSDAIDMATSGSNSVADGWVPLRIAGATARAMLVAAAAARLGVAPATLKTEGGAVLDPRGTRIPYTALLADAARLPVPANVALKPQAAFTLVGTAVAKADARDIAEGRAQYGIDARLPGMLYAAVVRAPHASCTLRGIDERAARAVEGVRNVVRVPSGIAVVADSTWTALRGRDALAATWDDAGCATLDSRAMWKQLDDAMASGGRVTLSSGTPNAASAGLRAVDAVYRYPFQAHVAMEPLTATVWVRQGRVDVWAGTQRANLVRTEIAKRAGLSPSDVHVNVLLTGGAFGRRIARDFILEAYEIARNAGAPVKSVWSREDDVAHDMYQPAAIHRLGALVDASGLPVVWKHATATFHLSMFGALDLNDKDVWDGAPWGGYDVPYAFASHEARYAPVAAPVPTGAWRSVDYPGGVFARESFLDELAHATGADPLALRMRLIPSPGNVQRRAGPVPNGDRLRAVLRLAAERAGWGTAPQARPGRRVARGIACNSYFGGAMTATVAEASVGDDGGVRVHRVVCAIDAGQIVNESGLRAQVEGGIVWGLTAALHDQITFARGCAEQRNFGSYRVVRTTDCPEIVVIPVRSTLRPYGAGESAVPPAIAAVANAVRAATGAPVRALPIRTSGTAVPA